MRLFYDAGMNTGNLYHLLARMPAVEAWEMPPALERAARQLVVSGRLRINADAERNFVRHGTSDWNATFTARELTDPALSPRTRALLARHVPPAQGAAGIEDLFARLLADLKKARGISPTKELRVARVLVQATDPEVVQLLLESGAEIFVSYAHNVGDLMAVHEWHTHGTASGLQATLENGQQVFVSCGGDPFFEGEEKTYTTDGFPALARMMVIGGQELGHFADLIRRNGQILGRYSLQPTALAGRRLDMARVAQLAALHGRAGLPALRRAEESVEFYNKRRKFSPAWLFWQLRRGVALLRYRMAIGPHRLQSAPIPARPHGLAVAEFLADMAFNLAPQADVYRHPDPAEEERIACIEAVARVPQQVNKWGHVAVAQAWPQLYGWYYATVLPACRASLQHPAPSAEMPLFQKLSILLRRALRPRPGYAPEG